MKFIQQLLFYCLWVGTGILAVSYLYTALFKSGGNNPVMIKQVFGFASIIVLFLLYKAYVIGEKNGNIINGIFWVLLSWVPYLLVLLGYLILAKITGKI
ncbi:MAG TPA: hypothetical protein PKD85_02420 [Saprospiraceae bacterium]|nr:hypothetical protein [Saprospiraceae bacterium]